MPPFANPESSRAGSSGNAIKHGFCAEKILSQDLLASAESMRDELTKIHDPWSDDEIQAVDQLALARAQQFELERAMRLKIDDEKRRAAELIGRSANDRLAADLARCRDNPALFGPILRTTFAGADWLVKFWTGLADELSPDASGACGSLPFSKACEAAMVLESPWQVDRVEAEGGWLMARYVRIAPDPEAAMSLWVEASKAPDGLDFSLARARRIVAKAPADRSEAAAELVARAKAEIARMSQCANEMRPNYETALAHAAESAVGTGSGDAGLEKDFRLLARYLTSARNRADRFERRLDALKRDRKRLAYRQQRDDEREARRLREESRKAMGRFENETHQREESRVNFYASSKYPEYAGPGTHSHIGGSGAGSSVDDFESKNLSHRSLDMMPQSHSPGQSQIFRNPEDAVVLRNERPGLADIAKSSSAKRPEREPGAEYPEKSGVEFAWLDKKEPLLRRLPMIRYRNWANPAEVFDDEVQVLRRLVEMPASAEGEDAIRSLFGSSKTLRRCWKAYQSWANEAGGSGRK